MDCSKRFAVATLIFASLLACGQKGSEFPTKKWPTHGFSIGLPGFELSLPFKPKPQKTKSGHRFSGAYKELSWVGKSWAQKSSVALQEILDLEQKELLHEKGDALISRAVYSGDSTKFRGILALLKLTKGKEERSGFIAVFSRDQKVWVMRCEAPRSEVYIAMQFDINESSNAARSQRAEVRSQGGKRH
jgi:hypothetical protein